MNLILSFMHVNKPTKTVGPFQAVRIDADAVRGGADHEVLAVHREHQWEVQGVRYHRLDASSRVRIHFEGARREPMAASRMFGPFARFSAVDGVAYTDDRVFAYVDAGGSEWFCYEDGRHWRVMVVTDATAAGSAKALVKRPRRASRLIRRLRSSFREACAVRARAREPRHARAA